MGIGGECGGSAGEGGRKAVFYRVLIISKDKIALDTF